MSLVGLLIGLTIWLLLQLPRLVAVLLILARWPDRLLAQRFITGFAICGVLEHTGIYEQGAPVDVIDPDVVCAGADDLLSGLTRQGVSEDAQFLWGACCKGHARGWAGPLAPKRECLVNSCPY